MSSPNALFVSVLAAVGCVGQVQEGVPGMARQQRSAGPSLSGNALSAGYQPPLSKQGTGEARLQMSPEDATRRYARLQELGLGYRQYNLWWSELESSSLPSSPTPLACPEGFTLVPSSPAEKLAAGYNRYRCFHQRSLATFDDLLRRDAQAGMQSGVVLWSTPKVYRHPACQGMRWAAGTLLDGCVPRDDAMDDLEDFVNLAAARWTGGAEGRIQHFILWNEGASDGWFDYSPVAPKGDASPASAALRLDKYAAMMRRAHQALLRHSKGVMLYASTDQLWDAAAGPPGHLGTRALLEGLWARLGTTIAWSVAVHPYGDPEAPAPRGLYTFQNLELVTEFQEAQLRARGIADPAAYPQAYLIASEQGWSQREGIERQARSICFAHAKAMSLPTVVAVAHNYFHSIEPQEADPAARSGQGEFFGLLRNDVSNDLGNMLTSPTGRAYASTGASAWGRGTAHYCCELYQLGCGSAGEVDVTHDVMGYVMGDVMGYVDQVVVREGAAVLAGWACARGLAQSIEVQLYRGGPPGEGAMVQSARADRASEPAVAAACDTSFAAYRFELPLTESLRQSAAGDALFVAGISPVGGANALLEGSGAQVIPELVAPGGSVAPPPRPADPTPTREAPTAPPVAPASVPVHRFFSASAPDHFLSTNREEGRGPPAYVYEGIAFEAYAADAIGLKPLYRCVVPSSGDHFTSDAASCEGQVVEGTLGWIASSPGPLATRELVRCYQPQTGDHLTTTNRAECAQAGYTIEGVQGYVK